MNASALPYWLSLLIAVGGAYGVWRVWQAERTPTAVVEYVGTSSEVAEQEPLAHFELPERSGGMFKSSDMRGKVWVASYFFTACPGSCLKLNQALASLQKEEGLEEVKFVSITCDPQNDSLEQLAQYADRFEADPKRWYFCRGQMDYVQRVGTDILKIAVKRQMHTDHAVVIGRDGKVINRFKVTDPVALNVMEQVLREATQQPTSVASSQSAGS
jgi:cytochrome oxidase Cu insertion factor (SCO1/SenC/PrrC family)